VHRDLKPSNIMVARDGRIKVLDFGLSKLSQPAAHSDGRSEEVTLSSGPQTARGVVVGRPGYMAPEQAAGAAVDARSDVFSLGVVLFEMASGERPGPADLRSLLQDPARPLLAVRPTAPPALARLVDRCLKKDPAERYPSAIDVQRALNEAAGPRPATEVAVPKARPRARQAIAAALVLVTAGVAAWICARRAASGGERTAAGAEAERLVDDANLVRAWQVAKAGLERWPAHTRLQGALRASTDTVTIATDPPGAEVLLKAYTDVGGEWIRLGRTPLEAVRAPLGMLCWRIAKEGFEPLEARLEVGAPAAAAGPDFEARPIRLRRAGEGPPGAVFVPGGVYGGKELADYWIDRTEVSNRDFRQLVDRGGYQDPALRRELERTSPSLFDRLGRIAEFSDRAGRPGPELPLPQPRVVPGGEAVRVRPQAEGCDLEHRGPERIAMATIDPEGRIEDDEGQTRARQEPAELRKLDVVDEPERRRLLGLRAQIVRGRCGLEGVLDVVPVHHPGSVEVVARGVPPGDGPPDLEESERPPDEAEGEREE
jgi:hypothetical protein